MTCQCQICGAIIEAVRGPMLLNPGTDPAAAQAVAEISTFDLLAGKMSQHIERHRDQANEMLAVMHLGGKVYAMTWADSADPEFQALRDAWRTGVLQMMMATTNPVAIIDEGNHAAGGGALVVPSGPGAPPSGDGSNEKNSFRNASS